MKKSDIALLIYVIGVMAALALISGCVAKHPKCVAYDNIDPDPMFKTNLERNLYK